MTLTQRSYGIGDADRDALRVTWEERFARLRDALGREPGSLPAAGSQSIEIERTLPVPRERAWKACTDPVSLVGWFCDRAEFTPQSGRPYHFLWTSYGEQPGKVIEVENMERIRLAWDVPAREATTELSLSFHPVASDRGKCRIVLKHSGWGEGKLWQAERSAHRHGWTSLLAMLEFYLRDGGKGPRRSFILRRRVSVPVSELWKRFASADGLASWLGEDTAVEPREGGVFRARSKSGERLQGSVTAVDPALGFAIQMSGPEASYLEFSWSGDAEASQILVTGLAYGLPESWPLRQRIVWSERLARITAAR